MSEARISIKMLTNARRDTVSIMLVDQDGLALNGQDIIDVLGDYLLEFQEELEQHATGDDNGPDGH